MYILLYWIWLTQINGLGPKRQRSLLKTFKNPENIYRASLNELLECGGIGDKTAGEIIDNKSLDKSKVILKNIHHLSIKLLNLNDPLYPLKAKELEEMPVLLYYKGNLIKNSMGVTIVGARRCSEYGKSVVKDAATYLAKENISVISGMAKGIDGYAHTASIKAGGYTVAILGNGLDISYPPEHIDLMEEIILNGAIISEYPPGVRPKPRHFPRRNLLISAWSHKILVIEAGEKSGSIITADYGNKYGKEVFALPDNIYRQESLGSNKLIHSYASIYLDKKQLLIKDKYKYENLLSRSNETIKELANLDKLEKAIIEILKTKGSKTLEELSFLLCMDNMDLVEKLSLMELEDKVEIQGSKVYVTKGPGPF